jgi:mannose-6-phosphate isomerase-like protein (cupin superfamily)
MSSMPRRRDVLSLGALAALAANGAAPKLPNATLSAANAKVTKEHFGELRIYFDGPTEQLKAMTAGSLRLNAGMTPHPPHEHPEEEMQLVIEGSGEFSVDGKTTPCSPGSLLYAAPGHLHGIQNTGAETLSLYVFKWAPK